jgi:ribosome maturation factor RimP
MVTKEQIRRVAESHIQGTGIFLVDVRLSSTGRITVLIDRPEGVTIDDCASLSKAISSAVGEEIGDFDLNVSSPGLDMPFLVYEQYLKNEGRMVEVVTAAGELFKGTLMNVTQEGFELSSEKKIRKGETETVVRSFNYEDLKTVKVIISFK